MFNSHKHNTFYIKHWGSECTIDQAVDMLLGDRNTLRELRASIAKLRENLLSVHSDLAAIHAHYRDFLCGDCCHQDVCRIKDIVKYGYECEDKACPEMLEIEVELLGEELRPEETEGTNDC